MSSRSFQAAPPHLRGPALELLFQHYSPEECSLRVATTSYLFDTGRLNPDTFFILREGDEVTGVFLCLPIPGGTALVWPPQVVAGPEAREREMQLITQASAWLRSKGVRLAQSLLLPAELEQADSLLANGFQHLGSLRYLRHDLDLSPNRPGSLAQLTFQPFTEIDENLFTRTLEQTYEQTLDIPEINGLRSSAEIMIGHQSQGRFDPARWWLAWYKGHPAGAVLLTEFPDTGDWDLSYLGLIAPLRGRGLGKELVRHAIRKARQAGAVALSVSVDARNEPACRLYCSQGFQDWERREIVLALWPAA